MNKIVLILILGISLINLVSATLTIFPQPLEAETQINNQADYQITLTNNYNFDIFDFQFGNLVEKGFSFPNIAIEKNSSQTVTIQFLPTESIHENVQVPVSFKYFVELPTEPQTYEINLTDPAGFNPNFIALHEGDSVKFNNKHVVDFDVVIESQTYNIPVNSSITHVFNTIGTTNYYDIYFGYSGTIDVLNKSTQEKAHNPNYDINWVVNIDSILNPTTLKIDNSKEIYEIEYGKFKKGLLTIQNNGTEKAELISLTSTDWITFNKNDINIEPGEEDWVEYTITPIIFDTNNTDKNYEIEMKIKASNSEEYSKRINVFIPFKEVSSTYGEDDLSTFNWLQNVFCPQFPTSFLCDPETPTDGNRTIYYNDSDIPINVSKRVIYDIQTEIKKLRDSGERTNNELKTFASNLGLTLPELKLFINQSLTLQQKNEKKERTRKNATWIIGFFIALIVMIGIIIKLVNKKAYKNYLSKGQFRYRKY